MAFSFASAGIFRRRTFLRELALVCNATPDGIGFVAHLGCTIAPAEQPNSFMYRVLQNPNLQSCLQITLDSFGQMFWDGKPLMHLKQILEEEGMGAYLFNTSWHPYEMGDPKLQDPHTRLKERMKLRIACLWKLKGDAIYRTREHLARYASDNAHILRDQIFPLLYPNTICLNWQSEIE